MILKPANLPAFHGNANVTAGASQETEQAPGDVIPTSIQAFTGGLVSRGLQRIGVQDRTLLRLRVAAIIILPLVAWLPLLLLTAIDGKLLPGSVQTPFLLDLSAHIRLLAALPLFVLAARVAEARLLPTIQQFVARRIVPEESDEKFGARSPRRSGWAIPPWPIF